jgi:zinc protease
MAAIGKMPIQTGKLIHNRPSKASVLAYLGGLEKYMRLEKKTQSNNLETLFVNSAGASAATVQIWFRAGSALEDESNQGIAHFLEHMFFKGTPTRPGSQIAHEIETYGGEVNAFTSFDYTCYYINTPNTHIKQSLEILLDMVSNPEFKQEELEPERDVVFEEYRRSLDNSNQFNFMQLQKSSFQDGYAHPILGREDTIKNFSREQLIDFRTRFYNTNNAMLIVAGDIQNSKELEEVINEYQMPTGTSSSFPKFEMKKSAALNAHTKEVRQTTMTLTIQAPDYDSNEAGAEDLAINCLAYGETSRLYKKLVTSKPIASVVSGSTMYFAHGGTHYLRIALPQENLEKVTTEFVKTLKDVMSKGIKEEEITKIKNQYIASKIYERESLESYAFSLGHGFAQNGDIHCEDDFINRLRKTSPGQVNEALKTIFSRAVHVTIQTPKDEKTTATKKIAKKFQEDIKKLVPKKKASKSKNKVKKSKYDSAAQLIDLKPGIKLVYRQNEMTPTFVMHAYMKGGLSHETDKNCGTHFLLGKSMTYGYKGTNYDALRDELENKSSSLNGFSGKNAYGLTMHSLTEYFDDMLGHFMGTLLSPELPQKYVNLEKKFIKRALENYKEDPVKQCFRSFNRLVFNAHPYSLDLIGNEKTLKAISRESLKRVHNKHLKESDIVLTYCGDLKSEEVIEALQPYLKKLKARKSVKTKIKAPKPKSGKDINIEFDREQTQIFIGRPGFNMTQKQDVFLKMLSAHLSGQSSELFVEVRDRQGLCYAVQPVHHSALEAGYWGIYIAAGHDKTDKAIAAITGILDRLQKQGLSKVEFERVKTMLDGQNLITIQTNEDYANIYSVPVLHGLSIDLEHVANEKIRNVDYDEFQAFLSKFLKTDWNVVKVGR